MDDSEDWNYDSGAGEVKTKIEGPFGQTWVLLDRNSRYSVKLEAYQQKVQEYLERTGKSKASQREIFAEAAKHEDFLKLAIWVSDQKRYLSKLSPEERQERLNEEADAFGRSSKRMQAIMQVLLQEERDGKRITTHNLENTVSLTPDSPPEELITVIKGLSHCLSEKQRQTLEKWFEESKKGRAKHPVKEESILLRKLDSSGFSTLTSEMHPDFLRAAICDREAELGNAKLALVQDWINAGDKKIQDRTDRIRIFHKGIDNFEESTEIYLANYQIDYVELVQKQAVLAKEGILLPEHKKRLDNRYDQLLSEKAVVSIKGPETLQVPIGIRGKTMELRKDSPSHVFDEVAETYGYALSKESRDLLFKWSSNAPVEAKPPDTIRAYDRDDFNRYRVLHKFRDLQEIETLLQSGEVHISRNEKEKARDWVDGLQPIFPRQPEQEIARMMHSSGLKLDINLELVERDPAKVVEMLGDTEWTTTHRNTLLIKSWLHKTDHIPEHEILYEGRLYNRNQTLEVLKQLADTLVESQFQDLSGEQAKKLLTWIYTKEKFGDDFYKGKTGPEPEPVPLHPYEQIKQDQEKLGIAMEQILGEIEKSKTKARTKEKDEPFPSV